MNRTINYKISKESNRFRIEQFLKHKGYSSQNPSLGVSTIIFGSLFRFGTATVSINAGFFCFLKT